MRTLLLLPALGALTASCATAPEPQRRNAASEQHLQQLLAGKTPGETRSCLPTYRSGDMVVIDEDTVLFRDGASRVWRSELRRACPLLASGHYTLVTKSFGGQGLCGGDIVHLADTSTGSTVGSCVWGDFTLYSAPRN